MKNKMHANTTDFFYAIKLNPSQTLRLAKERNAFFEHLQNASLKNAKNFCDENESEKIIFAHPLLCPLKENFSKNDFLSIKRFSIFKMQKICDAYFFPCEIEFEKPHDAANAAGGGSENATCLENAAALHDAAGGNAKNATCLNNAASGGMAALHDAAGGVAEKNAALENAAALYDAAGGGAENAAANNFENAGALHEAAFVSLPPPAQMHSAFFCATNFSCKNFFRDKKFSLKEFFFSAKNILDATFCENAGCNAAGGVAENTAANFWDEKNFFFNATSFKFCRVEIEKNSWKIFDCAWKKIQGGK